MINRFLQPTKRFVMWVAQVIVRELPLFILTLLLWGVESVRDYEGVLNWEAGVGVGEYFGRLCIVFFQAFVLAALVYIIRYKRTVRVLAYFMVIAPVFAACFLRERAGMEICATALQMVFETNTQEIASFLKVYVFDATGFAFLLALIGSLVAIVIVERYWRRFRRNGSDVAVHPLLRTFVTVLLLAGFIYSAVYATLFVRAAGSGDAGRWAVLAQVPSPHDPVTKLLFSVRELGRMRHEIESSVASTAAFVERESPSSSVSEDSLTIVLVVGESYIRSHSALYGYGLPTTPRLSSEQAAGRLYVFADVVTPVATTFLAMRQMFFTSASEGEPWYEGVFFPAVFKDAGFRVTFLDNQTVMETGATRSGQGYMLLNAMYHPEMASLAYDTVNSRSYDYDAELLGELPAPGGKGRLDFVMIHLKGQHFDARAMFPHGKGFDRFAPSDYARRREPWMDDTKRQRIADYDNATLYNDYVLGRIIDRYKKGNAAIIYLSDHGEEVYDYRDQWGRTHSADGPEQAELLFRVPFVVWLSDVYRTKHPEAAARLRAALSRPFAISELPHLLFGLAQLNTALYSPSRDPLSPVFTPRPRILSDGRDFDKAVSVAPAVRNQKNH